MAQTKEREIPGRAPHRKTLRPRFHQAMWDIRKVRGVSVTGMARAFKDAVYPGTEGLRQQKLDNWINIREGVPDVFFLWLDKTYHLTPEEKSYLMACYQYDVFADGPKTPDELNEFYEE